MPVVERSEHFQLADVFWRLVRFGRQLLPGPGDEQRISGSGGVMLVQRIRGYSIDAGCSLQLTRVRSDAALHHGIRLSVALTQLCPT